ncbi:MAG: hypothetical protein AB1589_28120 [Cyanobacteriota bacterium]
MARILPLTTNQNPIVDGVLLSTSYEKTTQRPDFFVEILMLLDEFDW